MSGRVRRMKLKICVVGERAVGKTSLLNRYVYDTFDDAYRGTLGAKLHLISFRRQTASEELVEATVSLFDFMGEKAMRDAFRDAIFWGAHGFLAVTDLTRPETLYALPDWINAVVGVAGDIPYAVVLNKADLVRDGAVGPQQTDWLLKRIPHAPFFLTSAKTGEGVGPATERIVEAAIDRAIASSRARRAEQILTERILQFAHRRGTTGVSQHELLVAIKGLDPVRLEDQIEKLKWLGLVTVETISAKSYRLLITEAGEKAVARLPGQPFVVEEPT